MVALGSEAHRVLATSPNISASVRVVDGELSTAEIVAAADANRVPPSEQQLLDALVRDAVGAWKSLNRGRRWDAVLAVQRMRQSLLALRGRRDSLRLEPADPAGALTQVIAEATTYFDVGPRRAGLLEQIGTTAFQLNK